MTMLGALGPQVIGRRSKAILIFALVGCFLAALTGCSLIGDVLQQKTTTEENLKYQRVTAQNFKKTWTNTDVITFTQEGSIDGSGSWAANATVTVDGNEYRQIIGPYSAVGDKLPLPAEGASPSPVLVNYSNGTTEVLR